MIPEIIHFCWLSGDEYPALVKSCIDSWQRMLPDYQIVLWDTNRFDINSHPYVKAAFEAKKYAFCADYIRIFALYTMGGIYLDSDVMVYKSFDPFLVHKSFTSIEFHTNFLYARISGKREKLVGIEAAVIGSERGEKWLKDILDYYDKTQFYARGSKRDYNIMPRVIARVLAEKYNFEYIPIFQELSNGLVVYSSDVFSDKRVPESIPTKYSSHLCNNSWGKGKDEKLRNALRGILRKTGLLKFVRELRGLPNID